jgi:hypothetical protein
MIWWTIYSCPVLAEVFAERKGWIKGVSVILLDIVFVFLGVG